MPRIRKKTSNRGTTNQRVRIKRKVAESHKKAKKHAKKDIQWKSKHTKDPGIPNNFPYKDQILAEIADERRKAEEEKQLRKDKKRQEREGVANNEENGEGFDGIASLGTGTGALTAAQSMSSVKGKQKAAEDEDMEDAPILINHDYADLETVLDKADVVLEVLSARDPLAYHSKHLLELVAGKQGKKLLRVVNKIDTTSRESVQSWLAHLRSQTPTFPFRSASAFLPSTDQQPSILSSKTSKKLSPKDALGAQELLDALIVEANDRSVDKLTIAVVGVATTGKTSIINSLQRKTISPVYKLSSSLSGPSTTKRPLESSLQHEGKTFSFIDTPSISWTAGVDEDAEAMRAKDVLVRNRGRIDRAKDPIAVVTPLILRANSEDLMLFYNLPAFTRNDATAFLSTLAKARNLTKKHGELDTVTAARIVLRDWSTDSLPYYTSPPQAAKGDVKQGSGTSDVAEATIMETISTRKELKKGRGLIRVIPSVAEQRKVALNERWDKEGGSDDEDEEDDAVTGPVIPSDEEEIADDDDVNDEKMDDDEDEEEEEEEVMEVNNPPPSTKRKRVSKSTPAPLKKKVAFEVKSVGKGSKRPSKLSSNTSKKARK